MFGFAKVNRPANFKYQNNFLRTVVFQIGFQENQACETKKQEVVALFKDKFPRVQDKLSKGFKLEIKNDQTPILQSISDESEGFEMRSIDGLKVIIFNKNSFSFVLMGKGYVNYEGMIEEIKGYDTLLSICGISEINRIAIRKINIIEFKLNENASEILEYVLNGQLLSNLNYFPNKECINQNINSINYKMGNELMNLKYGLVIPPPNFDIGQVVLDIDRISVCGMKINEIEKKSSEINNEIFNVFNWAISENAEKLLNNQI